MPESASPSHPAGRRRRRPGLTIRALMILVLVVGGGIGWAIYRARTQRLAVAAIEAAGGKVAYDFQFSTDPERMKQVGKVREPAAPRWLRRWLDEDFFRTAAFVTLPKAVAPAVLGAVAKLDRLQSLQVSDSAGLEHAWPALAGLKRLEQVGVTGPGLTDEGMITLGGIRSLRSVRLVRADVTAGGLALLALLPDLRSLTLGNCPALADSRVAKVVAGLPPLEEFSWSHARTPIPLTARALADYHLGLRRLALIQGAVADADLEPLGVLKDLTVLNLQQTTVTDAGLAHLAPLRRLERLWVDLPGVTDAGMKVVGTFEELRFLDLSWSRVGDAGLADLAGLKTLETLLLSETAVTDAGIKALAGLGNLQVLGLPHTGATDEALATLGGLGKLRSVNVGGTAITPAAAARFRAAHPQVLLGLATRPRTNGPPPIPQ